MLSSCSRPKHFRYIRELAVLKKYLQSYGCVCNNILYNTKTFVQYYKNAISKRFLQDITSLCVFLMLKDI